MEPATGAERLQKIIARSGLTSRRLAERWIEEGRVVVDGVVATIGQKADPTRAEISIDGVPLPVAPDLVHYLLNKPLGAISTVADPHAEQTVVDLVPPSPRVVPAGRLDRDTTGLLVLSNDGDLIDVLTHPRHGVTKTYQALVEGLASPAVWRRLTDGVDLEDGPAAASSVRVIGADGRRTHLELVMGEGRNRIVRRMCDWIGHPVVELHRSAIGPLSDSSLATGTHRALTIDEVRSLYSAAAP